MELQTEIRLKVGEKHKIRLKGLGAAGYNWEYKIEEIGKVVNVTLEFVDDQKRPIGILPPGYSLDELVTIQALGPGLATVRLAQRRSWEKTPLKERILEVNVTG